MFQGGGRRVSTRVQIIEHAEPRMFNWKKDPSGRRAITVGDEKAQAAWHVIRQAVDDYYELLSAHPPTDQVRHIAVG